MNLETQLAQLETAQFVRRVDDGEPTYLFKHALTQDSAYASLLKVTARRTASPHRAGVRRTLFRAT